MEPRQQPVQRDKACRSGEDAIEAAPQFLRPAPGPRLAVGLEILVEQPDAGADGLVPLLGLDVRLAEGIELVDEAFRMNPAQFAARYRTLLQRLCMLRNLELAGAVGDWIESLGMASRSGILAAPAAPKRLKASTIRSAFFRHRCFKNDFPVALQFEFDH